MKTVPSSETTGAEKRLAIDPSAETLLSLAQARHEPGIKGISPRQLYRWMEVGVLAPGGKSRIRLASIRVGGRRFTSREAVRRFIAAQNGEPEPAPVQTPAARRRAVDRAERSLDAAGIR